MARYAQLDPGCRFADHQPVGLVEGSAGGIGDIDLEARRPGCRRRATECHRPRRSVGGEVGRGQPGGARAEARDREARVGLGAFRHRDGPGGRRRRGGIRERPRRNRQCRIDLQLIGLVEGRSSSVGDVDSEARGARRTGGAAQRHRPRHCIRGQVRGRQPGRRRR